MPEQLVIVLPLPPRILSPNCPAGTRGGRFARAAAAKKYKLTALAATEDAARGARWEKATARAFFYHKTARRRDDDNYLTMLKAAWDGVVLAGLVPDDDHAHLVKTVGGFAVDRAWPRVELVFTHEL